MAERGAHKRRTPSSPSAPAPGLAAVLARSQTLQAGIESAGLLARSSVLCLPTGSGKTFMARKAIAQTVARGMRAAYLCPLRALAREIGGQWHAALLPYRTGVFTGERGLDEEGLLAGSPREADVGIFTAEKFDGYLRAWLTNLDWLAEVDLVVVDELHLLGDDSRGATLEGVLSRFRAINPYAQVICLSATLGNLEELARWLAAAAFRSDERPIPLDWRIETFEAGKDAMKGKAAITLEEVAATKAAGGQCIVFCQSRPRTESLAQHLAAAGMRAESHHAGRPKKTRERVEDAFRAGELDVLVATPTLAMGVNLPARKVVMHDLQRFSDGNWVDLPVNEIWQLAGRAGRLGLDDAGEVVLIAPRHNQKAARRYVTGRFEPILSQLKRPAALAEQALVAVGSGMARTRAQCVRVLKQTLYAHQQPLFAERAIEGALAEMIEAGMLEENEPGVLHATPLGRVAVRHQLSPRTVIAWSRTLDALGEELTFMDALMLASGVNEMNARLRASEDDLDTLTNALNTEPMRLRTLPLAEWRRHLGLGEGRAVVGSAKTAVALRAWTRLSELEEAAEVVGVDPHAVEEARKEGVRLLSALSSVCAVREKGREAEGAVAGPPSLSERIRALETMVCTGLGEQHATLARVEGIGPKFARRLLAAGIEDVEDLAQAEASVLVGIPGISEARAARWIAAAEEIVGEGGAFRYREDNGDQAGRLELDGAAERVDYYRWRRAQALVCVAGEAGWRVSGGGEPHQVSPDGADCDCPDAARGHLCKHRILVRHTLGDASIPAFAAPFPTEVATSLHALWHGRGGER